MLDLHYPDWAEELKRILEDIHGITISEFCDPKVLPKYYGLGYSPLEAFEAIDEDYSA